jgi:hypothetical protein
MKITEVLQNNEQALFEVLDAANDTEFVTEDVMKVVKSEAGAWSEPVSGEDFIAEMKSFLESQGIVNE